MKYYEELTRQRVDDAIQTGLRSQSVCRSRNENKSPARTAFPKETQEYDPQPFVQPGWFTLLFNWILGIGG